MVEEREIGKGGDGGNSSGSDGGSGSYRVGELCLRWFQSPEVRDLDSAIVLMVRKN